MPRRKPHRKGGRAAPTEHDGTLFGSAVMRTEIGPAGDEDERYAVRPIPGSRATKPYRCPGCDQEIMSGVAHVVVWPVDRIGGPDDRRHWHTGCWSGRGTRKLTRRWS
ncbi:hypothetical protein GCM10007304_43610 [Rhodococcoides trifolii]|uniref:ATP/GTP-binding protein n=1 Tax=Rhodococcoides trifolii TaxID=908250 RepID=A0A917G6R6_9NOCA|nr:ATP/GTP-binding protein [Rhodococcus trifolii]GGG25040.1 hypothetical protein GCM10007304_43610 [Rhodococcus trifolii]